MNVIETWLAEAERRDAHENIIRRLHLRRCLDLEGTAIISMTLKAENSENNIMP